MGLLNSIRIHGGFFKSLKFLIYTKSGRRKIDEEIDTLFFFLNNNTDITKSPKAKGNLRILHENNLLLLTMFDKICKNEGWTYWLDSGTLLGAIRHNGFIPWDDDMDVGMPRSDYDEAVKKLPEIFAKMNIKMTCGINPGTNALGIGIDHEKTGTYCDIFPYDSCSSSELSEKDVSDAVIKAHRLYNRHIGIRRQKCDEYLKATFDKNGKQDYFFYSPNLLFDEKYYSEQNIFKKEDIFPLKKHKFEDLEFNVPNNSQKFLLALYGNNFMDYPRTGILHHGVFRPPLSEWIIINNVDVDELRTRVEAEIQKL